MEKEQTLMGWWISHRNLILSVLVASLLAMGGIGWLFGASPTLPWVAAIVAMLAVATLETLQALRRCKPGVDVLALLTMAGSLLLAEYLAGAVIALMFASGRMLEEYAGRRARRALTALLERAPRFAHRLTTTGAEAVPVGEVAVGDRLLVKPGEIVPVDGLLVSESAQLDEAALTGESVPRMRKRGERLASGVVNAGGPLEIQSVATAADSTYAGVVKMVEQAQAGKAPLTRVADRYALLFTPLVLLVAGFAWALSGEPVRALAVLVVATPCPLILAAPVAIVAAMSRAARRGILIKSGAALEQLARVDVVLFDKTGTLTTGRSRLIGIKARSDVDADELLRLAASLEQVSQHVTAQSLVAEAHRRGVSLSWPEGVQEYAGEGLRGRVDGREVAVGSLAIASLGKAPDPWARDLLRSIEVEGLSAAFVGIENGLAGALLLADQIRLDAPRALRDLRRAGIRRTVMLSGDRQEVAANVAFLLGVDEVLSQCSPASKVEAVEAECRRGVAAMVGDGINDAPALAAAHVGIAMGARGSAVSSEAGDVVLMVDRLDRLPEGLSIARRGRRIALQSVVAGMGLSCLAMGFAAAGLLAPVVGALLQEGIDVAVILNAMRALSSGRHERHVSRLPPELAAELRMQHDRLQPALEHIERVAMALNDRDTPDALPMLHAVAETIEQSLLPHEHEDERQLYPKLAPVVGGFDPLGRMSRGHREILRLGHRLTRRIAALGSTPPDERQLRELRRLLFELSAVLRLHFAQEDELYFTLSEAS